MTKDTDRTVEEKTTRVRVQKKVSAETAVKKPRGRSEGKTVPSKASVKKSSAAPVRSVPEVRDLWDFFSPAFFTGWILSFALARCVQISLYIPGGFWQPLLLTLAGALFAASLLFSRKSGLATLGVLSAAAVAALIVKHAALYKHFGIALQWLVDYASGSIPLEDGYPGTSLILVSTALGFVIGTFGSKRIFFPGRFSIAALLTLYLWILGHSEILPWMILVLIPLGVDFAASFGQYAQRKKAGGAGVFWSALWSLPVVAAAVLIGFVVVATTSRFYTSDWVGVRLDVVNDYLAQYTGLTREQENIFSLSQTGFSPLGSRLGGKANPLSLKAFDVKTSADPMLLRGAVYDTYTGRRWKKTEAAVQKRVGSDEESFIAAFTEEGPDAQDVPSAFYKNVKLTIYPSSPYVTTMFMPFRVSTVEPVESMTMLIYYNDYGEVYASRPVRAGNDYTVTATLPDYTQKQFGKWVNEYQTEFSPTIPEEIRQKYSALSDEIPEELYKLAAEITEGCETDYDKAEAIMVWLARNMNYTLEPETPDANRDFVLQFLESGEGYCTYYGSAMAVLGRCAGLCTRYVEGFKMPEETLSENYYRLKLSNAHAWSEVYLAGIGWIPFDPLSIDPDSTETTVVVTEPEPTMDISQFMTQEPEDNPITDIIEEEVDIRLPDWVWIVVASVVGALLIAGVIILWERKSREARRFRKTPMGRIQRYYADILKILRFYNADCMPGETVEVFAERIDKWLYLSCEIRMRELAAVLNQILYNRWDPTEKDARLFRRFRDSLKKDTRKAMPLFFFLHYTLGFPYRRKKYS